MLERLPEPTRIVADKSIKDYIMSLLRVLRTNEERLDYTIKQGPNLTGVITSIGNVTSVGTLTTALVPDSTDARYVTDAEEAVLDLTSGTNTGDQNVFGTINYPGDAIVAVGDDYFTFVAGTNITISGNNTTHEITISALSTDDDDNIDGGAPDSVYGPDQHVDGGAP